MRRILIAVLALAATFLPAAAQAEPAAQAPNGPYGIYNLRTGKCLDLPGFGPGRVDGPVFQYTCNLTTGDNQRWFFSHQGWHYRGEIVSVWNAKDNLCLDLPYYDAVSATTRVNQFHCRGAEDNQFFIKEYRSEGGYRLVHLKTLNQWYQDLCLDVDGFGTGGDDARITLYYCSDYDDHRWIDLQPQ